MVDITIQAQGRTATVSVELDDLVETVLVLAEVELGVELSALPLFSGVSATPLNPQASLRTQGITGPCTLSAGQPLLQRRAPQAVPAAPQAVDDQVRNLFGGNAAAPARPQPPAGQPAAGAPGDALAQQVANLFSGGGAGAPAAQQQQQQQWADPDDPEVQRKMYERIQQQAIEENMALAMEDTPEAFGSVVMLYVQSSVNGHPMAAFVDSGAQMTVMSPRVAEQCNLTRLIDKRFSGMAKGVGSSRIIGRIHMAQVKLGEGDNAVYLPMSITVIDQNDLDFLIGLDQLRRHRMCIDLQKVVLRCETHEFDFLAEHQLPDHIRNNGIFGAGGQKQQEGAAAGGPSAGAQPQATGPAAAQAGSASSPAAGSSGGGRSAEQTAKVEELRAILPHVEPDVAANVLEAAAWNVDVAVGMLAE